MNRDEFKTIMQKTIEQCYPEYTWTGLFKYIENKGCIRYDGRKSLKQNQIDISNLQTNKDKLDYLFNHLHNIVLMCEGFEYEKAYRYSSIFKYNSINLENIESMFKCQLARKFDENEASNDELYECFKKPTIKIDGNKIYIKFSLKKINKIDENIAIKYSVLTIIDKEYRTIEIRQDILPIQYQTIEKFYAHNIIEVKEWLRYHLKVTIEELDLQAITRFMKSKKTDDVKVTAMRIRRAGMLADLDAASNADLTLPIIDELRTIIKKNAIFTNNTTGRDIKKILETFMMDIEEKSDLPSAKILWIEKKIQIHMYHGEVEGEVPLLRWLGELKDKECMDYVTHYIINSEKELRAELED